MKRLTDFVSALIPDDESSPQSVRVYRLRIALVACSAWLTVVTLLVPALFIGLPLIGRVAWAEEIDSKIARAVSPIQQDIAELRSEIKAATAATNAALAELIYQDVVQLTRQRCASPTPAERDRLRAMIRARLLRYQQLSGDLHQIAPACADL